MTAKPADSRALEDATALLLLAVLGVALFTTSLAFLPIRGDDHHQLADVLAVDDPLPVFTGSFWRDYPYYRPLHTFLLWLGAQAFEARWWPHQLLSLTLHLLKSILLAYAAFRMAIFDTFAVDTRYEERPILIFGGRDLAETAPALRVAGYGETAVKNAVAVVLPIFDNQGLVYPPVKLVRRAPLWLLTPVLLALTWIRPLSVRQRQGLLILALSALVHSFFFAVYLLYLGQIGFCLLIGGGRPRRRRTVEVVCAALLLVHVFFVARLQSDRLAGQRAELARWSFEGVPADADPALAAALLVRYDGH